MQRIPITFISALAFFAPALAFAASISITNLSPGTSVFARNDVTFKVVAEGFLPSYSVADSYGGSSIKTTSINAAGNFFWSPGLSDIGTHTITITGNDYQGTVKTVAQTITVLPPPSIAITALSVSQVNPGSEVTFQIVPTGFTNPSYSVSDSVVGSSVGQAKINSSGYFSWTPSTQDNGDHTISVYASDALGHSDTKDVKIRVGTGPSLSIQAILPGKNVTLGEELTFTVLPMYYTPSAFSIVDTFPGTTLSNANINSNGQFSWMPSGTDAGTHTIVITGMVGFYGDSASVTETINVLRPGESAPAPTLVSAAPTASVLPSTNSLNDLQAKLAELNAKIAAQTTGTPAPTVAEGMAFKTYLYRGMENDEVLQLQKVLASQGLFSAEPNGTFGPLTVEAVKKFQAAHGLDQIGVVGPATREALNKLSIGASSVGDGGVIRYVFKVFLEKGAKGAEVMELQKRLKTLGYFSDEVTGFFGGITEAAVKALQSANGIDPRGWVGPATRAILNK